MKFFQAVSRPSTFDINRGSIKLVREEGDYAIRYPDTMEGHIFINQADSNINVNLTKDFPSEGPIVVNLNGLPSCNVNLENGVVRSEYVCPNMKVKIHSGTLSADVPRGVVGLVTGHVDTGVLTNKSGLQPVHHTGDEPHHSGLGMFFGSHFWDIVGIGGIGFNNHAELMGTGEATAQFHVETGTMEFS
jgi:hypothetical protein